MEGEGVPFLCHMAKQHKKQPIKSCCVSLLPHIVTPSLRCRVEPPIPDQEPIGNLQGAIIAMRLGLILVNCFFVSG